MEKSKPRKDSSLPSSFADIGRKLKTHRIDQGLTLIELSKRSGVSFSLISKIENGKISGGFKTIYKICRGLGVLVADMTDEGRNPEDMVIVLKKEQIEPHCTSLYDYYPQATRTRGRLNPSIMVVRTTTVPTSTDWSNHEGEEVMTVLSGSVDLHYQGREPLRLEKGDSACFDSGTPHAYVCTSEQPAEIIFVSTRPVHPDSD